MEDSIDKMEQHIEEKNRAKDKIRPAMKRSQNFSEAILWFCGRFYREDRLSVSSTIINLKNSLCLTREGTKNIIEKMINFGLIEKRKVQGMSFDEAFLPTKKEGHIIIMNYIEEALANQTIDPKIKKDLIEKYKSK